MIQIFAIYKKTNILYLTVKVIYIINNAEWQISSSIWRKKKLQKKRK